MPSGRGQCEASQIKNWDGNTNGVMRSWSELLCEGGRVGERGSAKREGKRGRRKRNVRKMWQKGGKKKGR